MAAISKMGVNHRFLTPISNKIQKIEFLPAILCLIKKIRPLLLFQLLILNTGCGFHAHLIESKQRNKELKIEGHKSHFQKRFLMKIFYVTLQKGNIQLLWLQRWFY